MTDSQTQPASGNLRGFHVKTPYGWGICIGDETGGSHVQVALTWRLHSQKRVQCAVLRKDISDRSFCAAGQCVLTKYGTGVLLDFRPTDNIHHVQLWGPFGQGRNNAYLKRDALCSVIPAAAGFMVNTPLGTGTCCGYQTTEREAASEEATGITTHCIVAFPWGTGFIRGEDVQCPSALLLPLISGFLHRAAELCKVHSDMLTRFRDALSGLGLEGLQGKLVATASEAMDAASHMWDELESQDFKGVFDTFRMKLDGVFEDWDSQDVQGVVDNVRLKVDELLGDSSMTASVTEGIAVLNKLACKAEGFDGNWAGKQDGQHRCTIEDAVIKWHWGDHTPLEIWGSNDVSMELDRETFRGKLQADGSLTWSDGDEWVHQSGRPQRSSNADSRHRRGQHGCDASESVAKLTEDASGLLHRCAGDLRRIVQGEGLEGDIEKALRKLATVAENDEDIKRIVTEMHARRGHLLDLRGQVTRSKTAQVLRDGQTRFELQLGKLKDIAITPQFQRIQSRSEKFLTRLLTDKKCKSKAEELFSVTKSRLAEKWKAQDSLNGDNLEAWTITVKQRLLEQLGIHKAMLVESLGGLNLQQMDVRKLITNSWHPAVLERQLQHSLTNAMKLNDFNLSGTELLDRFESSSSLAQVPVLQRAYKGLLTILADLNIDVPLPVRKLLEAQAAGCKSDADAWKEAIVQSLDDETVVKGASDLVSKGENMLVQFQSLKESKTLAKVMEHLEKEDIERELLKRIYDIDAMALLDSAEDAATSTDARDRAISQLKDACLDFILKILPDIHIEKVSGNDNGCDWEINDISFSEFSLRKENVDVVAGKPTEALLRITAWDISALFRKLKVSVKQTSFPFLHSVGTAEAKAEKLSVVLVFKLQSTGDGNLPSLVMSTPQVHMESLELWVGETNYAVIINALSYLFADVLKDYACVKLGKHLEDPMGPLVDALNSMLTQCLPFLMKLGYTLPAGEGEESERIEPIETLDIKLTSADKAEDMDGFPAEIDWSDPGSCFAVRT